ncbi:MAG TPA: PRTRC system protein B [Candidatus Angelobacter sp.]|nr:PRTRC system protein B [Candidatus Angelobacter sp.]
MNISVNIGRSQDYKLSRALLVYGTSDYNGFPYRHPFLTVHEVVHQGDTARLAAGQLVTPDLLAQIMAGLGRSIPLEILPERVLVRTTDTIVWWMPACERVLFFSDRADATLIAMNGQRYPQPPLVFKASGSRLWVRALKDNARPHANTIMHIAPYWNCDDRGNVCTGSMRIPKEKSVSAIDTWEISFFQSEFTHAGAGRQKPTDHPHGVVGLWKSLRNEKMFPMRYLVPLKETLATFVNPNEPTTHAQ